MDLNDNTILVYAMHCYENPHCMSIDEFKEDLNRHRYLKRLFSKYRIHENLRERLILNHLIIMRNMFGIEGSVRILFFMIDEVFWNVLIPFLDYLNFLPPVVKSIRGVDINISDIEIDKNIVNKLTYLDEEANF